SVTTRLLAGLARRRAHTAARPHRARPAVERLESRLNLDISIDFVGGIAPNVATVPMDPSEVAGAVPDANWNNGAGYYQFPGQGPLNDQNGNPVPGTSLLWFCANTWDTGIPDAPGDFRMMKGYLDMRSADGTTI